MTWLIIVGVVSLLAALYEVAALIWRLRLWKRIYRVSLGMGMTHEEAYAYASQYVDSRYRPWKQGKQ